MTRTGALSVYQQADDPNPVGLDVGAVIENLPVWPSAFNPVTQPNISTLMLHFKGKDGFQPNEFWDLTWDAMDLLTSVKVP